MTSHDLSFRSSLQRVGAVLRQRFVFSSDLGLDGAVDHADFDHRLHALEDASFYDARPLGSAGVSSPAWRSHGLF